jgi:hypothetical protein
MREIAGVYYDKPLPVGTKVKFENEKLRFTVRASNVAFLICTRPLNIIRKLSRTTYNAAKDEFEERLKRYEHRKTVIYTIVDFANNIRGPENLVFGRGAETDEQCRDMLERLTKGESEVSSRRDVPLDIVAVQLPSQKRAKNKNAPRVERVTY